MDSQRDFLASGVSGLVERLPSGDVIKSPRASDYASCCRALTTEAQIYEILGPHARLVKVVEWNSATCCLTMEYMPNGNLGDYLSKHNDDVDAMQRLYWVLEAAEGLQLLHSADIIHCAVEPKNFLLDEDLGLRISDFTGSSIKGAKPVVHAGTRFSLPSYQGRCAPTVQDDLFGLGETIYTIMTGVDPFQGLGSEEVRRRYEVREWGDLTGILCGEIIGGCWQGEFSSAKEIYDAITGGGRKDKNG